jgi:hypothetical protein
MQNLAASYLTVQNPDITLYEEMDYSAAREDYVIPANLPAGGIFHLPLWKNDLILDGVFDLIICNYLLDELPVEDFNKVMDILTRCLAPEGVIYCRGSQQRSMFSNLYLFGFGTYHQKDITKAFLSRGFVVKTCDIVADTITRTFVHADSKSHPCENGGYAAIGNDIQLIERIQCDFVTEMVAACKRDNLPVVIYAEPGFEMLNRYLKDHLEEMNVVGITNNHILHQGPLPYGVNQYPLSAVHGLGAKAFFVTALQIKLALREMQEALMPISVSNTIRSFNLPVAFGLIG